MRIQTYLQKNLALFKYYHTLDPRTAGFGCVAHQMMERNFLNVVYDIIIAYLGKTFRKGFVYESGGFIDQIQIWSKRYPVAELPDTDERWKNWLKNVWKDKEVTMKKFKERKQISEEFRKCQID